MDRDFLGFILIMVAFMGLCLFGGYHASRISCEKKAVSFEQVDFGLFQGCLVKHNGRWLPLDNIRGFDDKG